MVCTSNNTLYDKIKTDLFKLDMSAKVEFYISQWFTSSFNVHNLTTVLCITSEPSLKVKKDKRIWEK